MFKGKIVTLMLSGILATNISPIVNTFSSDSITNSSETTQKELLDTSISDRLNTDISDQQTETSDIPTTDSTRETLSSSEEEKESTTESSDTTKKTSKVEAENEGNTLITTREAATDGIEVSSWSTFVQAIRDETVTKVVLTGDFDNPSNTDTSLTNYSRKNDLEIDGRGHRADFKSTSIQLGSPTGSGIFHMHDIVLNQRYGGANSEDIVGTRLNYTNGGKWRYRFGNITTEPDVQRLARASHSEVTVYGEMDIDTRAENFYLGSLKMEDGTNYKGNVNYYNFSIFWYNVAAADTSTGASKEFTIGKNCRVDLTQSQTTGTTYPAVYSYYQALTVGENSTFNVNMPGNAVRFDMNGAGMTIKAGAIVNLTSKQNSGSVVAYSNDNNYLIVEPGAYFYTIGVSNQPLINLSANGLGTGNVRRRNNQLILNSPAQYDIRNLRDGNIAVQVAMGNYTDNLFQIANSDIDLWKLTTQPLGPSDETYTKVAQFSVTGNGSNEQISATTSGLNSFSQKNYRRISGMNQNPIVEWVPVTDADKTIKARVIIGYVPDNNGLNTDGEVSYIPVYASKNQGAVTITDTHGKVTKELLTDENGYVSYQSESFNLAGKDMQARAQRGPWISEEASKYLVIDVTPPEPAIIDSGETLSPMVKELSGNGEAGAIVTITLNGEKQTNTTNVSSEGKWTLSLSNLTLTKDDVLQIFLQDTSGKVTQIPDPPKTNTEIGNIEPAEEYAYRDAVFQAATKIVVIGTLELKAVPETFDFGTQKVSSIRTKYTPNIIGNLIVSDTRGDEKNPWRIMLKEKSPLVSDNNSLAGQFYYTNDVETINITSEPIPVEEGKLTEDGETNLSDGWNDTEGLSLKIPIEKQLLGTYKGTLEWTLEDVP